MESIDRNNCKEISFQTLLGSVCENLAISHPNF